ncbi:hypothetical protein Q3G72_023755 [Acer saccharum]|nr:hypothetical protein Q3G72_023755 [Acer saccharum]
MVADGLARFGHVEDIAEWAGNFLEEFRKADGGISEKNLGLCKKLKQVAKWERPVEGLFKINTDAAVCSNRNLTGIGIVIRNHEGGVMGCSSQSFTANFSPQVAEATAIFRGILFAVDTGLLPAVVESDAKTIVDLISETPPFLHMSELLFLT